MAGARDISLLSERPDPAFYLISTRALFPVIKRPKHEADLCPPSSAMVKSEWNYTSAPSIYLHGMAEGKFSLYALAGLLNRYAVPDLYRQLGARQGGAANIKSHEPSSNIEFSIIIFYKFSSVFAR
jgi:hypothetical protein